MKYKKVAILGIGLEGVALCNFLRDKAEQIFVFDLRQPENILGQADPKLQEEIKLILSDQSIEKRFGDNYLDNLEDFDIIFRSPGIYFNHPSLVSARKNGIKVSSQIKLFFELCPCQIIGVTGTKGKGTTVSLIFDILKENFKSNSGVKIPNVYLAGNIGSAAISLIPNLKSCDIVILELSSFQLADLEISPHIAVFTNLDSDHLDYHKNYDEYIFAKFNLLRYQSADDVAILNTDSTYDSKILAQLKSKILYFSKIQKKNAYIEKQEKGNAVFAQYNGHIEQICTEDQLKIIGRHNLENIAAATLASFAVGANIEAVRKAVRQFDGLPHRLEFVVEKNGVRFINDSFATNPSPTMAALRSIAGPKVIILGGSSKGADFAVLAETISENDVSAVVLIGDESLKIEESLTAANYKGMVYDAGYSLSDAVKLAAIEAKIAGAAVIFSPACASFDMFKNYKERGEKYKEVVLNLEANDSN